MGNWLRAALCLFALHGVCADLSCVDRLATAKVVDCRVAKS